MLRMPPEHYRPSSDYGSAGGYGDPAAGLARRRLAARIAKAHHLVLVDTWPMPMLGIDCTVMEVPGVGPIIASTVLAKVPDAKVFRSGRDFAAWIGLTGKDHGTGGRHRPGRISKQGDRMLLAASAWLLPGERTLPPASKEAAMSMRRPVQVHRGGLAVLPRSGAGSRSATRSGLAAFLVGLLLVGFLGQASGADAIPVRTGRSSP